MAPVSLGFRAHAAQPQGLRKIINLSGPGG